MKVNAILRKFQYSPKKARLVVDKIRGLKVDTAQTVLLSVNKKSSAPLLKLLNSAIANAINNFKLKREDLILAEVRVDGDGMLKRRMPRARGSAFPILKRISRIEIVLSDGNDIEIKKQKTKTEEVKEEKDVKKVSKKVINKVKDNK